MRVSSSTWSVQGNVLLNNGKHYMTSLSLLAGRTVSDFFFYVILLEKYHEEETDFCVFVIF